MKEFLQVTLIGDPYILVREVLPSDDEATVKDKNRLPFMTQKSALIKVYYVDKIPIPKDCNVSPNENDGVLDCLVIII